MGVSWVWGVITPTSPPAKVDGTSLSWLTVFCAVSFTGCCEEGGVEAFPPGRMTFSGRAVLASLLGK